ncbi:hypothetical protein [Gordonia sihwensis]|uniref:hypothetical protein n=1 Tax=Gordonia sihwensis TaxID=173559 RepID=UPI003D95D598
MSYVKDALAADLNNGDLIDLTPLIDRAVGILSAEDRAAASDGYATVTAISEHGGHVDIGTDIFDVQVRADDAVSVLVDEE